MREANDVLDRVLDTVFCVRDNYGVVQTTIRVLFYSTTAAQENWRPCSEETNVYNETVKNKGLFSTIKAVVSVPISPHIRLKPPTPRTINVSTRRWCRFQRYVGTPPFTQIKRDYLPG
ncbi:hypothetical protein TNCV_1879731 [Trichonephila clavipes]|nr:hypothetical protein TNCV_1879731 [Trichonephila clavipes]